MQLPETLVGKQGKCPSCGQMITVQQSLGTPPVGTPPVGTPLVDTPLVGTPLIGIPLVGTPVGTPPSPSGSPAPPSSTQSALESGAALLDGENIEVLDSKANGNFAVEATNPTPAEEGERGGQGLL